VIVLPKVVAVTKKGQITIPKRLREKYGIKSKILMEDCEQGIVLKPLPSPAKELGSSKSVFKGRSARQLLEEARKEEVAKEKIFLDEFRKVISSEPKRTGKPECPSPEKMKAIWKTKA